ncbi:DUF4870 domain-containing protein [Stutzerimonas xanthomarina]|jgi:uncharacterized membrane protein/uncharacterized membrane protein YeaQ/YmgE (transglycosylase-associated protein family)|uniref:DUF4870 domain-containing protein n=1 Tax=Stutzerimonas xanthomarina TaxID=271420 RepID=A0A427DKF6_9GAMM|nr:MULTISPECIES: DUF4870 domain-containing protein [Stutzerimonas]RRV03811.1 DUF4870 domain-containing protein [Stutzerimonas xanthomarina]
MLPPYGAFTLILALLLGSSAGLLTMRKNSSGLATYMMVTSAFAFIISCLVEAYGASDSFFYDFGDHLIPHFAIAVITSIVTLTAVFALVRLATSAFTSGGPTSPKAYVPHALGLMNVFLPIGSVAIAIYWVFNRKHPLRAIAARQAFLFQLVYLAIMFLLRFISPATGVVSDVLAVVALAVVACWLVLTIYASVKAWKNPYFSYPFLGNLSNAGVPAS